MRRLLKSILCVTLIFTLVVLPVCASAASTAYILKVNASNVRLREKDSSIIMNLSRGTRVLYWGEKKGAMYKVYTSNGKTGYVYSGYLASYGAIAKNRIGITTKSTPVYKKSGSSLKKSGTVAAGTMLLAYAYNSSWVRCKTVGGTTVYVPRSAIKQFKK